MKNASHKLLLAISIAVFSCSGCSVSSRAEKAANIELNNYKTFNRTANQRKSRASSEIVHNNIQEIVTEELEKKGLSQTDKNPDLILDYSISLPATANQNRRAYSRVGGQLFAGATGRSGFSLQPAMIMSNPNRQSTTGTLTINMLDANTKKLVWQGWAKDNMNSNSITTKQANTVVKAILKKFDN